MKWKKKKATARASLLCLINNFRGRLLLGANLSPIFQYERPKFYIDVKNSREVKYRLGNQVGGVTFAFYPS